MIKGKFDHFFSIVNVQVQTYLFSKDWCLRRIRSIYEKNITHKNPSKYLHATYGKQITCEIVKMIGFSLNRTNKKSLGVLFVDWYFWDEQFVRLVVNNTPTHITQSFKSHNMIVL